MRWAYHHLFPDLTEYGSHQPDFTVVCLFRYLAMTELITEHSGKSCINTFRRDVKMFLDQLQEYFPMHSQHTRTEIKLIRFCLAQRFSNVTISLIPAPSCFNGTLNLLWSTYSIFNLKDSTACGSLKLFSSSFRSHPASGLSDMTAYFSTSVFRCFGESFALWCR